MAGGGIPEAGSPDAKHAAFFEDADVLIHDTQYDVDTYASKVGWGHSPMEYVVDLAAAAGVRRLVLYHHDPDRADAALDAVLVRARAAAATSATGLEVDAAAEGSELVLTPGGRPLPHLIEMPAATEVPALEHFDVGVAVVTSDPALAATVRAAAEAEDLAVRDLEDEPAEDPEHTIVVLDVDDGPSRGPFAGGWSVLGATRQAIPKASAHVTDWLVLPCTTAHVRTKLRAAVLRRACRWMAAPLPEDEDRRLAALRALDILDTPPESRFDQYTEQARRATGHPDRPRHARRRRPTVVQVAPRVRRRREPPGRVDVRARHPRGRRAGQCLTRSRTTGSPTTPP